jgi:hypothetical protein
MAVAFMCRVSEWYEILSKEATGFYFYRIEAHIPGAARTGRGTRGCKATKKTLLLR